jgi:hypothetical protein
MAARGVPLTFRSLGPGAGKMLVHFMPGGAKVYFEESSHISPEDPHRAIKRQELERKYGITLVPRKPAPQPVGQVPC